MIKTEKTHFCYIPLTGRKVVQNRKAGSSDSTEEFPSRELAVGATHEDESEASP